jgi:lipoprotein-anchoring transpeptidase ErfK/SrfK
MKRLLSFLIVLLAAGALASTVLADDPPPATTTTAPTTPALVPLGVTLGGVAIGGLDADTAAQAVLDRFGRPVTLRIETTTVQVVPSLFALSVPIDSAIARALTVEPNTPLGLRADVNPDLVRSFVAKLASRFDRKPVASRLLLRALKPFVTKSVTGRTINEGLTRRDLTDELVHGTRAPIKVQSTFRKPAVTEKTIGPVIVIRRGSNRLTLYNGERVVRQFGVATGQAVYPTPLGTRWMGLSVPGVGIHGTPQDGSIGYSLSHGCIRMHIPEAEWLFEHVDIGTPVYIVSA